MASLQKITPCLWFDDQAEPAAQFYTSVFRNSRITETTRYTEAGREFHGKPAGSVMLVAFELDGQKFTALNGGPIFKLSEAVSFMINCDTAEEVDYFWDKLTDGGDPAAQQCGWLKDRFGLSWQLVPAALPKYINGPDAKGRERAMAALMPMKKLDIDALRRAYEGK